ncbi:hypothetical protein BV898_14800 [Hypsibius exemplaris]|uniref:Eclosion hormone n=1 Tax=Hypsibius exemplaris TaxID=2072580 RepID=A0A9X6NBL6_HYPEX|nr:hypothetical protein BV898_14800 [Hypsibius exemplaris]
MKDGEICIMAFLIAVVLACPFGYVDAAPVNQSSKTMLNSISICITNCAQCHDLVGEIFAHRKCSRDCVARKGALPPDCTNPATIKEYLQLKNLLLNPA